MNHTPLIQTKHAMVLAAMALSCPFAQAGTVGYLSTSTAAGTSEVGPSAVIEGQSAQDSINLRQIALRQERTREAMRLLQEGRTAYSEGRYKDALDKYEAAWNEIPKAPATQDKQKFIIDSIGDASIAVAIEYAKVARYDDAEQLLQSVLLRDPGNKRARRELSLLRDPIRNNPASTPEHVRNVQEVQRLLELGYGYLDLGRYDEAYAEANRILEIDPYNSAARKLQESVSNRRSAYFKDARMSYRAKLLSEVDALWEESQPSVKAGEIGGEITGSTPDLSPRQVENTEKLNNLIVPSVSLDNQTVEEATDFLRAELRRNGINLNVIYMDTAPIVTQTTGSAASDDDEDEDEGGTPTAVEKKPAEVPMINKLEVTDIPFTELLSYIQSKTGCTYSITDTAVALYPPGARSGNLVKRRWPAVPDYAFRSDDDSGIDDDDGFDPDGAPTHKKRIDPEGALRQWGVSLDTPGSAVFYNKATKVLTVIATPDALDEVDQFLVDIKQNGDKMIKVSAKFVEVSQTNEEELSFDWVVNPFSIANKGNTFLGGVTGANSSPTRTMSDFVSTGGTAFANKYDGSGTWPLSNRGGLINSKVDPISNGLVTGSLRSGTAAITANSMDALIASGSASQRASQSLAPGILSLSGIYDSGSYQSIMRGLSQKKGVDVMSAPSLVIDPNAEDFSIESPQENALEPSTQYADDTDAAKIEVIRRFIYPTGFTEPTLEVASGGGGWNSGSAVALASPAHPDSWAVEELGVVMCVRAKISERNNDVVQFERFDIRVVEFEGFVNYGTPITQAVTVGNMVEQVTLTDNRIDMPVFNRRFIKSNPCIANGHTIAIGGMIEDNVQKVEDKVPVFGDLPLIGRFFRSNAESHIRKNMLIFVTADIIDTYGRPIGYQDGAAGDSSASASSSGAAPSLFPDDGLANP